MIAKFLKQFRCHERSAWILLINRSIWISQFGDAKLRLRSYRSHLCVRLIAKLIQSRNGVRRFNRIAFYRVPSGWVCVLLAPPRCPPSCLGTALYQKATWQVCQSGCSASARSRFLSVAFLGFRGGTFSQLEEALDTCHTHAHTHLSTQLIQQTLSLSIKSVFISHAPSQSLGRPKCTLRVNN